MTYTCPTTPSPLSSRNPMQARRPHPHLHTHLFLRPRCVGAVDVHCEQAGGRRLGFALSCERLHKLRAGLGPQHARRCAARCARVGAVWRVGEWLAGGVVSAVKEGGWWVR
eukprot:359458-Chlamydomonas_euryale.AAC.1